LHNAAKRIVPLSIEYIHSKKRPRIFTNYKTFFMSLTLRTTLGCTEAVIDDDGGLKRFYQIADILSDDLQVNFTNKEDDFDAISWDFHLGQHELTLQYSIYNGISMFPTKTKDARKRDNKAVVELANVLEGKLLTIDLRHGVA
jgi:hypothetical protein